MNSIEGFYHLSYYLLEIRPSNSISDSYLIRRSRKRCVMFIKPIVESWDIRKA